MRRERIAAKIEITISTHLVARNEDLTSCIEIGLQQKCNHHFLQTLLQMKIRKVAQDQTEPKIETPISKQFAASKDLKSQLKTYLQPKSICGTPMEQALLGGEKSNVLGANILLQFRCFHSFGKQIHRAGTDPLCRLRHCVRCNTQDSE